MTRTAPGPARPDPAAPRQPAAQPGGAQRRATPAPAARPSKRRRRLVAGAAAAALIGLLGAIIILATEPAGHPRPRSQAAGGGPSATACGTGSLQLIGSTAFMPIAQDVADAYMHDCPGATIAVTGGDSAYGVTTVRDAVKKRNASAGSMIAMYDGIPLASYTTGLRPYPVGALIYSVVAHGGLFPASSITTGTLRGIFVRPGEQGVVAVGRRSGSGTRLTFDTKVLARNPGTPAKGNCPPPARSAFSFTSCTEDSTADLLGFVNGTPNAIGYAQVPLPLTGYPQVSVLNIDGFAPTAANVRNGSYRFWTVEHLYAAMQPTTLAKDFLDFLSHHIESNQSPDFIACSDALKRVGADC